MKNKVDVVKIIGIAGTVLGMAASLLSDYSSKKNMEKIIDDKVNEALKNRK